MAPAMKAHAPASRKSALRIALNPLRQNVKAVIALPIPATVRASSKGSGKTGNTVTKHVHIPAKDAAAAALNGLNGHPAMADKR